MAARAQLRYNGKSYMHEDLVYICKKELKFTGLQYLGYIVDRQGSCLVAVGYKEDSDKREGISISSGELSCYNADKSVNDLVVNDVVYDDAKLMKIGNNLEGLSISFEKLSHYNVGRSANDLVVNGVVYDDNTLLRIGDNVASIRGGSCLKYHVNKKNKVVTFDCVEHGEHFGTDIKFVELEKYR